jgi:hypothetical protein
MPKTMCGYCNPIVAIIRTVKGVPYCNECGREISAEELATAATMPAAPKTPNNSFERGIRRDERGIPYLDRQGRPLRMRESFNPKDYGAGPVVLTRGNS